METIFLKQNLWDPVEDGFKAHSEEKDTVWTKQNVEAFKENVMKNITRCKFYDNH